MNTEIVHDGKEVGVLKTIIDIRYFVRKPDLLVNFFSIRVTLNTWDQ